MAREPKHLVLSFDNPTALHRRERPVQKKWSTPRRRGLESRADAASSETAVTLGPWPWVALAMYLKSRLQGSVKSMFGEDLLTDGRENEERELCGVLFVCTLEHRQSFVCDDREFWRQSHRAEAG